MSPVLEAVKQCINFYSPAGKETGSCLPRCSDLKTQEAYVKCMYECWYERSQRIEAREKVYHLQEQKAIWHSHI